MTDVGTSNKGFGWVCGINEGLMKGATCQVMALDSVQKGEEKSFGKDERVETLNRRVGEKRVEVSLQVGPMCFNQTVIYLKHHLNNIIQTRYEQHTLPNT